MAGRLWCAGLGLRILDAQFTDERAGSRTISERG
jgi:hypothetical protein